MTNTIPTLKLCSLEYSLAELLFDPPDLDDRAEKSSLFFLATTIPVSWSVDEELWRDGDR